MKRGLIVDDAAIMRVRLRDILEEAFQVVAEAGDGAEAVRMYENHRPDFVTLDISMPHQSGIIALEKIRALDPEAKIVMVSAVGQKRQVIEALQKGASDFIIKPFEGDRVLQAVHRLFQ
ncbi:response regulator [Alkalispirochaeta alkalica]|uniref:response regulator n=1 Tax=Alkalispirochaeta alkalica TaxID=46356 RepID=UPI000362B67E|nr:response regulator [Alkalispirochaeta alkalica]